MRCKLTPVSRNENALSLSPNATIFKSKFGKNKKYKILNFTLKANSRTLRESRIRNLFFHSF